MRQNQSLRSFVYMGLGLAILFYAIPQLPKFSWTLAGLFSVIWLLFGILVVGANLYYLIGVDKERRRRQEFQKSWEKQVARTAARLQYERRRRRMLRSR
ncbi:hypothetical protein [Effusibacillus dendaii]|uniref:Uncharacterized protein n=1 Tax=Effusibacillus dendaii TaxID=2743772 RepID=A0A7I8DD30_9BACL|nr:hypothetical protein [Effusibacillus dendaii]BCJ88014.1 hypothetical protein skT53_29990 [Effusibacillus dendaii]